MNNKKVVVVGSPTVKNLAADLLAMASLFGLTVEMLVNAKLDQKVQRLMQGLDPRTKVLDEYDIAAIQLAEAKRAYRSIGATLAFTRQRLITTLKPSHDIALAAAGNARAAQRRAKAGRS